MEDYGVVCFALEYVEELALGSTQPLVQWIPGYSFHERKSGRGVKLFTHLNIVPSLRMRGDIPPLPHASSWCGA
jgi:hypothetical protein